MDVRDAARHDLHEAEECAVIPGSADANPARLSLECSPVPTIVVQGLQTLLVDDSPSLDASLTTPSETLSHVQTSLFDGTDTSGTNSGFEDLDMLRITVYTLAGIVIAELYEHPCTKVYEVKGRIRALGGPIVECQALTHEGALLYDGDTLHESGIVDDASLQLAYLQPEASIETIKVVARCRPMKGSEIDGGRKNVVQVRSDGSALLTLLNPDGERNDKEFAYDAVFDERYSQLQVFESVGSSLVDDVLNGYNGTIMSYGQTGAGKSYTMFGQGPDFAASPSGERGLVQRSFEHIFATIFKLQNMQWNVRCSCVELYHERVSDLLAMQRQKMELEDLGAEDGFCVKDLTTLTTNSVDEMQGGASTGGCPTNDFDRTVLALALQNSSMGNANVRSSQIATIFSVTVESRNVLGQVCRGTLNLVECKGSERQSGMAAGIRESHRIGPSISALGNVITALADYKSSCIPYRDSKFTKLLKNSLGGNARTVFIACVSPTDCSYDETLSTLRYARRANGIKNRPKVNMVGISR